MGFRGKFKNKRDRNEPEIVAALQAHGISVERLDKPVDLICGFRGRDYLVEVKSEGGKLTTAQLDFYEKWNGGQVILRSIKDAAEWAAELRGVIS